jgi:hypothetical protein
MDFTLDTKHVTLRRMLRELKRGLRRGSTTVVTMPLLHASRFTHDVPINKRPTPPLH